MDNTPLVSICCVTYNHAPFIRRCLDGFLMQETSFPLEILIHDDASTDGTDEIIREYAARYPGLVFPIFEEENQYSKPNHKYIDLYNYERARGKYIAYCEGDDFWIDPLKLQKQVDFMETHPDYSVCFHNFRIYDAWSLGYSDVFYSSNRPIVNGGTDVDFSMYYDLKSYGGQPLTMLFRKSMYSFDWAYNYKFYRDTHEIYHLLKEGKGYYLDFVGGVYVKHKGGVCTSLSWEEDCKNLREVLLELFLNTKDISLRPYLISILLWNYQEYKEHKRLKEYYLIIRDLIRVVPWTILRVFLVILKQTLKSNLCLFSR